MKETEKSLFTLLPLAALIITGLGLALLRAQTMGFEFGGPLRRVITPNGDALNDQAVFCFFNPADSGVTGRVYSFIGYQIATMVQQTPALAGCPQNGLNPQSLTWDGKMNGRAVSSGVYLYAITAENHTYTGTIVVAR